MIGGDNPKPSVDVMPIQDPNKPPQDGSYRANGNGKALTALEEVNGPLPDDAPLPQFHPGRKAELDRQHRNIDIAQATIERHFSRLERKMRAKLRKSIKATGEDWDRWDREFADDIHGTVERIIESEGRDLRVQAQRPVRYDSRAELPARDGRGCRGGHQRSDPRRDR